MNKFMKKLMKKSDGFTLVELIVVIAILAILAGVAVPAYTGYITKAKDAAVVSELSAVLTAAQAVAAADYKAATVNSITVTSSGISVVIEQGEDDAEVTSLTPFYGNDVCSKLADTSYAAGAKWTPDTGWTPGT